MYTPSAFAETDPQTLARFLRQHSFATLVSRSDLSITASHLPVLLECTDEKPSALLGHMAKANGQWQSAKDCEVLVIFQGPHAYVSPRWYAEPNTVPTWNYTAVYVYGTFRLLTEPETSDILSRTVSEYETGRESPWSMTEIDPAVLEKLLPQIVGFRIEITRMEGKWKLNQNHSEARRQRVVEALRSQPDAKSQQVADLMAESLLSQKPY